MTHPMTRPSSDALLAVVDVQERLLRAMPEQDALTQHISRLIQTAAILGVKIVLTEQYPKGLGSTVKDVGEALPDSTPRLEKTAFSCWGSPEFCAAVGKMKTPVLVLTGLETHVCIQQTALTALERGCQVIIPVDTVQSRHALSKNTALALMREAGAIVTTSEALAFAWLRDAAHGAFKEVSAFFK